MVVTAAIGPGVQELKRRGVTLPLLWEKYRQEVGDTAFQFTAFSMRDRAWSGKLKRSMRQFHRAGEKLFADYAGPTVSIIDAKTGEVRPASIFVAVLGASSYSFAFTGTFFARLDCTLLRALLRA